MNRNAILEKFEQLNIWSRRDQRAPHKPLLVLYALGRWSRGDQVDGVWVVRSTAPLVSRKGHTDPRKSDLLAHNACAGCSAEVQTASGLTPPS